MRLIDADTLFKCLDGNHSCHGGKGSAPADAPAFEVDGDTGEVFPFEDAAISAQVPESGAPTPAAGTDAETAADDEDGPVPGRGALFDVSDGTRPATAADKRRLANPDSYTVRENPQKDVPSANETVNDSPACTRTGTVYLDPETNEYVMPPDFPGDVELRWKCDEATKITPDVINDEQSHWHYAAGHRVIDGEDWYDVREVYPFWGDADRKLAMFPYSTTLAGLVKVLRRMADDVGKHPVVEVDDALD